MEDQQLPVSDEVFSALRKPLEDPYPHDASGKFRTPNALDKKLLKTCNGSRRDVLLDTGFHAWFAYVQAESDAQMALDRLPDSHAEVVARQLCAIKPHPTVEALFHHIFYISWRGPTRSSALQKKNYTLPARQNALAPEYTPPGSVDSVQPQDPSEPEPIVDHTLARRNIAEQQQPRASLARPASAQLQSIGEPQSMDDHRRRSDDEQQIPIMTQVHDNNSNLPPIADNANPWPRLPSVNTFYPAFRLPPPRVHSPDIAESPPVSRAIETHENNHSRAFPDAKNIPSLLPHRTCASVVKSDSVATIRTIFGDTPSQCYLEIDVYAGKIPYIARELFGSTYEVEDGRLWSRLDSGASGTSEMTTLIGADRTGAEKLFGTVFEIVKADPLYVKGLDKGESVSGLVSLDIRGDAGHPSCLKVRSTAHTMSIIAKKLWPEFPFFK